MVEIANSTMATRASVNRMAASPGGDGLAPLAAIAAGRWQELAARAIEPNGYFLPGWELAVDASAEGRTGVRALTAWSDFPSSADGAPRLIGLMPAISLWRACGIPLPALANADPYGTLGTPLLDRDRAQDAAKALLAQAREAGAHALILRDVSLDGAAMKTLAEVLRGDSIRPRLLQRRVRACLDATRDSETLLREALGARKLKELRRQRRRLAEHGVVRFEVARTPAEVASAIETFLALEASGWKGRRGTALAQKAGDAAFARRATMALAATGQCEIVSLRAGEVPVAAAIVLRHQDRAFYFKIGIDERFAKFSPGVQMTLDLTRHLCADPEIATADSTATADHPMINPIWRGRFAIGDVLVPLRRGGAVVRLIHMALTLSGFAHGSARRAIHLIRGN